MRISLLIIGFFLGLFITLITWNILFGAIVFLIFFWLAHKKHSHYKSRRKKKYSRKRISKKRKYIPKRKIRHSKVINAGIIDYCKSCHRKRVFKEDKKSGWFHCSKCGWRNPEDW